MQRFGKVKMSIETENIKNPSTDKGAIVPPLVLFDDNVVDPICRKGQEKIYDQLSDLLCSLNPIFENGFDPCFTIEGFLERIGKGTIWENITVYQGVSIPLSEFSDGEKLADQIDKICKKMLHNIRSHEFFSKENLNALYQESLHFVGNKNSAEFLNNTFHRVGKMICDPKEDHFKLIEWSLLWDRLVAFPILWERPEWIEDKIANEIRVQAEKFYDCLCATYHNQNFINSEAPFTRLILHRRFISHILRLKNLKYKNKKNRGFRKLLTLYQIRRLEIWVEQYKWAFKPNSDLLDVKLMHYVIYGFSNDSAGDSKRREGICVTCDPIESIELRLALCHSSHQEFSHQVIGWDLPLCPGTIICLKYDADRKFSHVKTINIQQFFSERNKPSTKIRNFRFKINLFAKVCREWLRDLSPKKPQKNKKSS